MNKNLICIDAPIKLEDMEYFLNIFTNREFNSNLQNHVWAIKFNVDYNTIKYGKHPDNPLFPNLDLLRILLKKCQNKIFSLINYYPQNSHIYKDINYLLRDLNCQNFSINNTASFFDREQNFLVSESILFIEKFIKIVNILQDKK